MKTNVPATTNTVLRERMLKHLHAHRRGVMTRQEAEWEMIEDYVDYMEWYALSPTRCLPLVLVGGVEEPSIVQEVMAQDEQARLAHEAALWLTDLARERAANEPMVVEVDHLDDLLI